MQDRGKREKKNSEKEIERVTYINEFFLLRDQVILRGQKLTSYHTQKKDLTI